MGLFDIFSDDNAQAAAAAQRSGLQIGNERASSALASGREALNTNYAAGLQPFQQNFQLAIDQATKGINAYADALGLNGDEGYAAALGRFREAPGYQSALDAATENVLRNRARTGDLRSGATNIDLQTVAQNLQNQQWDTYLQQLAGFGAGGQGAASAAASGIGNLYSNLGNQLAANYGSKAALDWQTESGIGNANANAALAGNAASGNFVNSLMNIAGLGASAAPYVFSDERIKQDIEPVGKAYDGTNIYRYRYKGDPSGTTHIGVLAQEIEAENPDAVADIGGVKAVDYGAATEAAAALARFMEAA